VSRLRTQRVRKWLHKNITKAHHDVGDTKEIKRKSCYQGEPVAMQGEL
jgi:hypothetical protein